MANKSSKIKYYAKPAVQLDPNLKPLPPKNNVLFTKFKGPAETAINYLKKGKKTAIMFYTFALTEDGIDEAVAIREHDMDSCTNVHASLRDIQSEKHYSKDGIFYIPNIGLYSYCPKSPDNISGVDTYKADAIVVSDPGLEQVTFHDVHELVSRIIRAANENKVDILILGPLKGKFYQPSIIGNMYAALLNERNTFDTVIIQTGYTDYDSMLRGFKNWYKGVPKEEE